MTKTHTPELDADVLRRLNEYASLFRYDFQRRDQARWTSIYWQGLLSDGQRKSIEPMARRVYVPQHWNIQDPDQALQQFVNQSPWDQQNHLRRYRSVMAHSFAHPKGMFLIDDTSFPKQGKHSVGVAHQYCGALGKKANCQVAVSLHYVSEKGHFPLDMRLYLPSSWVPEDGLLSDEHKARLDKARVPKEDRTFRPKWQIALDLLDKVRAEGLPGRLVVADAGYGNSLEFRQGLAQRRLHYVVGVPGDTIVFAEKPLWQEPKSPRAKNPHLAVDSPVPIRLERLAQKIERRRVRWREGTKGPLQGRFSWIRVWPAHDWRRGSCAHQKPLWLLIEEQAGGEIKYALSNLPVVTSRLQAVKTWKSRWQIEQGYQQMKEELGLAEFEGRSWGGFDHHCCLVMLAFGFLMLERFRMQKDGENPLPWHTLPAIRRALQKLLRPEFPMMCPHCEARIEHPLFNLTE